MRIVLCGSAAALLLIIRLCLVLTLAASGTISGSVLAIEGVIGLGTTLYAWCEGKPDFSWSGLGVGASYLMVLGFAPGCVHQEWVGPIFWALFAAKSVVRCTLGRCCTLTGPVFVAVVQKGPYSVVRHPMIAVELLMAIAFAIEFPSAWNLVVLSLVICAKFAAVVWEEKFLLTEAAYRDYADRVRWRCLPGVW